SDDRTYRLDLDGLHREVDAWFEAPAIDAALGTATTQTERIARDWLAVAGKRWRPFLAACAFKALQEDPIAPLPPGLQKICLAVECFHKASLVHDDIEDNDALRYGQKTLHEQFGTAVALNVGDLLLGEGYRLIAESDASAEVKAEMLRIASSGHRTLCLGQGAELCWTRDPGPLTSLQVIDIFRQKTAPAFEVALRLGAAYGGASAEIADILRRYSEAIGIAYQIRDDLDDLAGGEAEDDLISQRPSLPLALALEKTKDSNRAAVESVWRRSATPQTIERVRGIIREVGAEERCRSLLDSYKEEAIRSLVDLENASLKGLLRRVISKIFRLEVKGWCSEFEARNASGGAAVAHAAG
ncbi:MAG TPA: polyprenyl synthetase family protein, partial [Bradyrhizobium sp.]